MKKKLIAILITLTLVLSCLTACGGSGGAGEGKKDKTAEATTAAVAEATEDETAAAGETADDSTVVASDYTDSNNWLAKPEVTKEVDTFYIYPTAYNDASEGASQVCTIDSELLREGVAGCYESQATAYEAATNVFAPYYRQINMVTVASISDEERTAMLEREPKADLFAALDYYFDNLNEGRPFILAAHSQGAQMMLYVLTEYMQDHPDYYEPMEEWMGFGPESYHGGDYTLWYTNIQENAKKRVEAYLSAA